MDALNELKKVIGYWEAYKTNPSTAKLTISGETLKQAVAELERLEHIEAGAVDLLKEADAMIGELQDAYVSHSGATALRRKIRKFIKRPAEQEEQ